MEVQMATLENPSDTHGSLIAASQVNGTSVYNLKGEKLGSIYDVILRKETGTAEYGQGGYVVDSRRVTDYYATTV
jgi:hypothetical protein